VLLSYLVTSRTRRELLLLLWRDRCEGSVSALARRARVSFAAAYRELGAMRTAGLARSRREGVATVYQAKPDSPHATILRRLLDEGAVAVPRRVSPEAAVARTWLYAAGSPRPGTAPPGEPPLALELVLAEGLALSHGDAALARRLPLVLWRHRETLDHGRLVREAARRNERQALGFFLELAATLGGDPALAARARRLQDARRVRTRPFFTRVRGPVATALAARRTPELARRWGFVLNMDLESFAAAFREHA
jgi:hypothetical protein